MLHGDADRQIWFRYVVCAAAGVLVSSVAMASPGSRWVKNGNDAMRMRQFGDAAKQYQRAEQRDPELVSAIHNRALAQSHMGEHRIAEQLFRKADSLAEDDATRSAIRMNLGVTLFEAGREVTSQDPRQAMKLFLESSRAFAAAAEADPTNQRARTNAEVARRSTALVREQVELADRLAELAAEQRREAEQRRQEQRQEQQDRDELSDEERELYRRFAEQTQEMLEQQQHQQQQPQATQDAADEGPTPPPTEPDMPDRAGQDQAGQDQTGQDQTGPQDATPPSGLAPPSLPIPGIPMPTPPATTTDQQPPDRTAEDQPGSGATPPPGTEAGNQQSQQPRPSDQQPQSSTPESQPSDDAPTQPTQPQQPSANSQTPAQPESTRTAPGMSDQQPTAPAQSPGGATSEQTESTEGTTRPMEPPALNPERGQQLDEAMQAARDLEQRASAPDATQSELRERALDLQDRIQPFSPSQPNQDPEDLFQPTPKPQPDEPERGAPMPGGQQERPAPGGPQSPEQQTQAMQDTLDQALDQNMQTRSLEQLSQARELLDEAQDLQAQAREAAEQGDAERAAELSEQAAEKLEEAAELMGWQPNTPMGNRPEQPNARDEQQSRQTQSIIERELLERRDRTDRQRRLMESYLGDRFRVERDW